MVDMKNRLNELIKMALKNGNKGELIQLRMLKSEITKVAKDKMVEINNGMMEKSSAKFIKQIDEQLDFLKDSAKIEVLTKVRDVVMKEFMPKQVTKEDAKVFIEDVISSNNMKSMKDMGKAMKLCVAELGGKIDGKFISSTVKNILGGK